MELSDTVEILVAPETVFDWFDHLDAHYLEWHPDHRACYWLKGSGLVPGAELVAEEILHGQLHKLHFRMMRVEPYRYVEFRLLGVLGLILPGGAFKLEPSDQGCRFTASLRPRFGWLLQQLIPARMQSIIQHQREEGQNLKHILEQSVH